MYGPKKLETGPKTTDLELTIPKMDPVPTVNATIGEDFFGNVRIFKSGKDAVIGQLEQKMVAGVFDEIVALRYGSEA